MEENVNKLCGMREKHCVKEFEAFDYHSRQLALQLKLWVTGISPSWGGGGGVGVLYTNMIS